jgi:hypothetical protein
MGLAARRFVPILTRSLWAMLCAVILVGVASAANFLTTAPEALSLLFEPFSLLLMPGLLTSFALAGPHDYSIDTVLVASVVFYALFFYFALTWLSRRRSLR